jgi:hypothetical protein
MVSLGSHQVIESKAYPAAQMNTDTNVGLKTIFTYLS